MYQEEIFSNAMTDAKKGGFESLTKEINGSRNRKIFYKNF